MVELITGIAALYLFLHYNCRVLEFIYGFSFFALLLVIFFVDFDLWIIPDEIIIAGLIIGIAGRIFIPSSLPGIVHLENFVSGFSGAIVGYLAFYLLSVAGGFFARQDALGYGDVKFAAMIGAFLGLNTNLFLAFFLAFLLGGLYGIVLMTVFKKRGKTPLPFGTFMAIGAFLSFVWGFELWQWYMRLLTGGI